MTDRTPSPLHRAYDRSLWQGGNRGGVRMETTPPASVIREWETKMDPAVFDARARVRRAYRTSYGERLAIHVTVILGVLAGCAIVWAAVWGVM